MSVPRHNNAAKKVMSGHQFRAWRNQHGYSLHRLARDLGLSVGSIQTFEANGISQVQALALAALEAKLPPIAAPPTEETS